MRLHPTTLILSSLLLLLLCASPATSSGQASAFSPMTLLSAKEPSPSVNTAPPAPGQPVTNSLLLPSFNPVTAAGLAVLEDSSRQEVSKKAPAASTFQRPKVSGKTSKRKARRAKTSG